MTTTDLVICSHPVPGGICAVSTLEQIYDKYGYHTLDRVLRLCIGTWEGETHSLSSNMLKGVARLVNAYGDSLKDDIFKEKNGVFSVKTIIRTAKERRAGSLGFAETLLINYNKKMQTHSSLPLEKLYTHKISANEEADTNNVDADTENVDSADETNRQLSLDIQ